MISLPSVRSLLAAGLLSVVASGASAQWQPTRPITLIVPWAAGGPTDQVVRVTAAQVEKALGQKVVVMNQPGASGSVGTKNVAEAAKDGYTWTAGAAKDIGTYKVQGMLDTTIQDWNLYLAVAHVAVVGVNADTPYQTMPELLAAMKAKPNAVSVATAGVNSTGHSAMEAIVRATGVTYKHVTYDGGNPAAVATMAGETQMTTQTAAVQVDMIRAKRIRPLAVISDKPLVIEGYGAVPPLSQFVPGFTFPVNYFGIFVPKGVPDEVVQTLNNIWTEHVAKSDAVRKYAESRGAIVAGLYGDEAQKTVMPAIQSYAWLQQEAGRAKVSPDTIGIPRP